MTIAVYIVIGSFGTVCNVVGDGAIAMVVNRFAKDDVINRSEELSSDAGEVNSASSATKT